MSAIRCLSAWNEPTGRAELVADLDVLDRGVKAPFGQAELFGGEQRGSGGQASGDRRSCRGAVGHAFCP